MTFWRNGPQWVFNILKCHTICLKFWDSGVCVTASYLIICIYFFSKRKQKLNLLMPPLCLLSSICLCQVQYVPFALPFSNYLPNFEIISETIEKKNLSYILKLNNEAVYSMGIFRMLLFSCLCNVCNLYWLLLA